MTKAKKWKSIGNYATKSGAKKEKWKGYKITKYKVKGGYHYTVSRPA